MPRSCARAYFSAAEADLIDRVAVATGESPAEIRRRGFHAEAPLGGGRLPGGPHRPDDSGDATDDDLIDLADIGLDWDADDGGFRQAMASAGSDFSCCCCDLHRCPVCS